MESELVVRGEEVTGIVFVLGEWLKPSPTFDSLIEKVGRFAKSVEAVEIASVEVESVGSLVIGTFEGACESDGQGPAFVD